MEVGLIDVDSHNFPNLVLMKISAYHKDKGDNVEWCIRLKHYDVVYVSKVFGSEYSQEDGFAINADRVFYGGTGYAIKVVDGKEIYEKSNDENLPPEIEHIYPDYSLYPELTKNRAFGFLTRGCPNGCPFCIVSQKEGRVSRKVADLSEWWNGQGNIELMDANILACKDHEELLMQLADSGAKINFNQGLDARFINEKNIEILQDVKISTIHFAWDCIAHSERILKGLKLAKEKLNVNSRNFIVYVLTNYETSIEEDMYRVNKLRELDISPDIRIYRKNALPKRHILRDLQRWCNNRFIYRSCEFADYVPRADGKSIRDLYWN